MKLKSILNSFLVSIMLLTTLSSLGAEHINANQRLHLTSSNQVKGNQTLTTTYSPISTVTNYSPMSVRVYVLFLDGTQGVADLGPYSSTFNSISIDLYNDPYVKILFEPSTVLYSGQNMGIQVNINNFSSEKK